MAVWIGSPAGSGKSALAASFLEDRELDTVWLRLQEPDADPGVLLRTLEGAVRARTGRAIGLPAPGPLDTPAVALDRGLRALADALPPSCTVVWDNCEHLAAEADSIAALARLLDRERDTARHHLFLSRRSLPEGLRRLQVSGELSTLGWPELKLARDEFEEACRHLTGGSPAASDVVDRWFRSCDGWFAALVLMAGQGGSRISAQELPSTSIFDYLASEVLEDLPAADRERLGVLSLLPHLTAPLSRSLTGSGDAFRMVERWAAQLRLIERSGDDEPVYRFHPLLRRYLRERWEQETEPEIRKDWLRRAAAVVEDDGKSEAAGELLGDAADWDRLRRLAERNAAALIESGRGRILRGWIERIPQELAAEHPWLRYWHGMSLRLPEPDRSAALLESAFEAFRQSDDVVGQYTAWLARAEAALIRFDDVRPLERSIAAYHALRQRAPRCPDLALRLKTTALAGAVMSVVEPENPRLHRLIRIAEVGARVMPMKVPRQALFVYLILHYANTGQIARMRAMARHLLPRLDDAGLPAPLRLFGYAMVGLHELISGAPHADRTLRSAVELAKTMGAGAFYTMPQCYRVYLALLEGDLEAARSRFEDYQRHLRPDHRMEQAAHDFVAAWLAAAEGDAAIALESSHQSAELCVHLHFDFGLALCSALRGQLFSARGDFPAARAELARLESLADKSGSRLLRSMHGFVRAILELDETGPEACTERLRTMLPEAREEGILAFPGFLRSNMARLSLLALRNDIEHRHVEDLVRRWRVVPEGLGASDRDWPWRLRIHTLGRFEVVSGKRSLAAAGAQRRLLEFLSVLVGLGGRQVPRAALLDVLWEHSDADRASHALDNLVHRVRKLVGREAIRTGAGTVGLNPEVCWVDTWALEEADGAVDDGEEKRVTDLYRGPFLPGEDGGWAVVARERMRHLFLRAVRDGVEGRIARGEADAAVDLLERACAVEPTAEELHRRLIELHLAAGRRAEAQRVHDRCATILATELGTAPESPLEAPRDGLESPGT
ncbi:MAG: BTAD domain-containing putative transcriptional regulator [Pseudomonadales bacterium]|nr:BTAD domain-containing putative transcriptional regulator [Pseudomonadales bacterium]